MLAPPSSVSVLLIASGLEALLAYPAPLFRAIGHPVSWIGALISRLDSAFNRPGLSFGMRRAAGVLAVLGLLIVSVVIGIALETFVRAVPYLGFILAVLIVAMLLAGGNLDRHVREVAAALRAEERGFVKTILGRRARFDNLRYAYRAANRIVQGGAADILKWKLVELDRWITQNGYDEQIQMLLTIHDSIVLQVREDSLHLLKEVKALLERVQVPPFNTKVPFTVDSEEPAKDWSISTYGAH